MACGLPFIKPCKNALCPQPFRRGSAFVAQAAELGHFRFAGFAGVLSISYFIMPGRSFPAPFAERCFCQKYTIPFFAVVNVRVVARQGSGISIFPKKKRKPPAETGQIPFAAAG